MTFVILACALPSYHVWWPIFVVLFYILAPIAIYLARLYPETPSEDSSQSNPRMDKAIFITAGFVISSFALPIVLARSPDGHPVIKWGACLLTMIGNIVIYTMLFVMDRILSKSE